MRARAEKEAASAIQTNTTSGKDDKKKADKGAAKGKNTAPVDDKNVPANLHVEYPQIEAWPNFLIYEKKFNMKEAAP